MTDASDCDDSAAAVHPGAEELCDGVDEDCDGTVDVGALDAPTWHADADGDGWGDASVTAAVCTQPSGYSDDGTDCDDTDAAIRPDAAETCNGTDDDCDGTADVGVVGAPTWYADADGDGYGDPGAAVTACTQPSGYLATGTDCDDTAALTHPGAFDRWYDGIDQACDGGSDYDQDGDGHDSDAYSGDDFDDADATSYPGALDVVDGVDNDGDGRVDYGQLVDADWVVYGVGDDQELGDQIASGDFDADGWPDLVLGDPNNDTRATNGGVAYVFSHPTSGTFGTADASASIWGTTGYDYVGWALAVGDLDASGSDDLILSTYSTTDLNRVCFYYSPFSATEFVSGATDYIEADSTRLVFGETLAAVGDQTGDGVPDMLVGNPWHDSQRGEVYLFPGAISGAVGMSSVIATLSGAVAGDEAGSTLASQDMDGDGVEDLIAGAKDLSIREGAVYVLSGPVTADLDLAADADFQWYGASADMVGASLAAAGDVNADGFGDLLVGYSYGNCSISEDAAAWLILGQPSFPSDPASISTADTIFKRTDCGDSGGMGLSGGDFDGDGVADIAYGAPGPGYSRTELGRVRLLRGSASLPSSVYDTDFELDWRGETVGSAAGATLLLSTDFDLDGLDDLVVGASDEGASGGSDGAVYLIHGLSW